ncbi:MAG: hypothetical protein ACM3RP_05750, partial [Chitinophagales bacterium]
VLAGGAAGRDRRRGALRGRAWLALPNDQRLPLAAGPLARGLRIPPTRCGQVSFGSSTGPEVSL